MSINPPRTAVSRLDTRIAHLQRLGDPNSGYTVTQANTALTDIHRDGTAPVSILVRRRFLARRRPMAMVGEHDKTPRPKPPLANLVRPRGVLLRLELLLLFLAQCKKPPATARIRYPITADPDVEDAIGLIDLLATGNNPRKPVSYRRTRPGMRAKQVSKALETLRDLQLLEAAPPDPEAGRGHLDTMWLMRETGMLEVGDVHRYKKPVSESVISIPAEFFTHGWVQVMTDSEIANWLMFRDAGNMRAPSTTSAHDLLIDADTRLGTYDLTRDTWDTHQTLTRLGLMCLTAGEVVATRTQDGASRFRREPHRFDLDDQPLQQDAHASMLAAAAALRDERLG